MSALLDAALESRGKATTAKHQIAITVCSSCKQGWQDGAGAVIAIDAAAVERAECDAQYIGSVDDAAPERARTEIPPATRRLVWRRDHGRCRVPGCRSARGLEAHHIEPRSQGGPHDPMNIVLLCSAHHQAHHRGVIVIGGTAEALTVDYRRSAA